jgi:hypothetical protein
MATPLLAPALAFFGRLRFPQLFVATGALFLLDLVIPDFIPFADELLLGMATLLLGNWKRNRSERRSIDPG